MYNECAMCITNTFDEYVYCYCQITKHIEPARFTCKEPKVPEEGKEPPKEGEKCGKKYNTKQGLKKHRETIHSGKSKCGTKL